jgi:hypothetical protein
LTGGPLQGADTNSNHSTGGGAGGGGGYYGGGSSGDRQGVCGHGGGIGGGGGGSSFMRGDPNTTGNNTYVLKQPNYTLAQLRALNNNAWNDVLPNDPTVGSGNGYAWICYLGARSPFEGGDYADTNAGRQAVYGNKFGYRGNNNSQRYFFGGAEYWSWPMNPWQ